LKSDRIGQKSEARFAEESAAAGDVPHASGGLRSVIDKTQALPFELVSWRQRA